MLDSLISLASAAQWLPPFMRPSMLALGVPAALVFATTSWFLHQSRRKEGIESWGSDRASLSRLPQRRDKLVELALLNLISVCFVVAMAGPYEKLAPVRLAERAARVVWVQDTSRSGGIEDTREAMPLVGGADCTLVRGPCGNRVQVGMAILEHQIMPAIEGSELGIVSFASGAKVSSYLTSDFSPIRKMLADEWITVGSGLGKGSDITAGLKTAVKLFEKRGARPDGVIDVIILACDGGFDGNMRELDSELRELKARGYKLIVIGLGGLHPAPIPVYDTDGVTYKGPFTVERKVTNPDGTTGVQKRVVMLARDDDFLSRKLAPKADALYIPVTPGVPLDISWPATFGGERVQYQIRSLYDRPLLLAMILLAVQWLRSWAMALYRHRQFALVLMPWRGRRNARER